MGDHWVWVRRCFGEIARRRGAYKCIGSLSYCSALDVTSQYIIPDWRWSRAYCTTPQSRHHHHHQRPCAELIKCLCLHQQRVVQSNVFFFVLLMVEAWWCRSSVSLLSFSIPSFSFVRWWWCWESKKPEPRKNQWLHVNLIPQALSSRWKKRVQKLSLQKTAISTAKIIEFGCSICSLVTTLWQSSCLHRHIDLNTSPAACLSRVATSRKKNAAEECVAGWVVVYQRLVVNRQWSFCLLTLSLND